MCIRDSDDGVPDRRPAVHEPVSHSVDVAYPRGEVAQRRYGISVAVGLVRILDPITVIDNAQLQTARAGVDCEDAHRSGRSGSRRPALPHPGQRQSRISGMSSKYSRT